MKDSTYGLQHLINRFKLLNRKKNPLNLNKNLFIDLDSTFQKRYLADQYVEDKKLTNLMILNNIPFSGYKEGEVEAQLFNEKNYREIEISCNRKVKTIKKIFEKARVDQLVVSKRNDKFTKYQHLLVKYKQLGFFKVIIFVIGLIGGIITVFQGGLPHEFQTHLDNNFRWFISIVSVIIISSIIVLETITYFDNNK